MAELIKTQKQYEETLDFLKVNRFAYDEANEIDDLIEALWRFVRAHTKLDHARIGAVESLSHDEYNALVIEFRSAREALPDWLVDA